MEKSTASPIATVVFTTWLIMLLIFVACSPASSVSDGKTLLEKRCSTCHSTSKVTNATKTRAEWEQTVTRMIGKGARLSDSEKAELVNYLAEIHGP